MAAAASPFFQDHSFDPFLFAAIGEERNGMLLTMQSALARLDLDPRFEAANLSRLPAPAATERLTSLLSSLPIAQFNAPTRASIMQWIGLLPHTTPDADRSRAAAIVTEPKLSWPVVGVTILALILMFAAQIADHRTSAAPPGSLGSAPANQTESGATKGRGE